MVRLNEQISRIRKIMGLNEGSIGADGQLTGITSNVFDEFPEDVLKTLKDEYGHIYKHNFDWNSKSREFTSSDPGRAYDAEAFNDWLEQNEQSEFVKNQDKIISAVRSDLLLMKRRVLAKKKLDAFEELIKPVFGKHITGDVLTKFEEEVIMNPDATVESIERGFQEAKNLIDQYGNIDPRKMEKSTFFTGGDINIPNFERFVQANPEYRKTFDVWSRMNDESMDLDMRHMNAFRGYSYEPIRKLYDFLMGYRKGGLQESEFGSPAVTPEELNAILRGYLIAALWTEEERLNDELRGDDDSQVFDTDEDDVDIDDLQRLMNVSNHIRNKNLESFTREDMEVNSVIKAYTDIRNFIEYAGDAIHNAIDEQGCDQVGHDLWLTRNHHGAGFWDRGYDGNIGDILTSAAHRLGEVDLFINDNMRLSFGNENNENFII